MMLENDLIGFQRAAEHVLGETWNALNDVRREAMLEMAFNMGQANLAKFKNMLAALADEDFKTTALSLYLRDGRSKLVNALIGLRSVFKLVCMHRSYQKGQISETI